MPCSCWYDPPQESKRLIKRHLEAVALELRRLDELGDPIGLSLKDVVELLTHLYEGKCPEKPNE